MFRNDHNNSPNLTSARDLNHAHFDVHYQKLSFLGVSVSSEGRYAWLGFVDAIFNKSNCLDYMMTGHYCKLVQ